MIVSHIVETDRLYFRHHSFQCSLFSLRAFWSSCVRRVFEVAKENDVHEIAFSVIHTEKKGFPADLAAHICIRTFPRFVSSRFSEIYSFDADM